MVVSSSLFSLFSYLFIYLFYGAYCAGYIILLCCLYSFNVLYAKIEPLILSVL